MKLKKFFALALAAATLALALTACGSKADDSADNSNANTDNQTGETVTVKLGVVGGIYDDLWASAKAALADEGELRRGGARVDAEEALAAVGREVTLGDGGAGVPRAERVVGRPIREQRGQARHLE